ncbi:MAG TPA: polymer-forming cytoskeletal protein [Candidatus Dormibacteraeota bacterium]|nr:polymer-forming cytoskeletal protein [Candidatus Dormibacteraeota bacterium]
MRTLRSLLIGIVAASSLLVPIAARASTSIVDHGNVYIGKDVTIEPGQVVHGDLTVIAGNATVQGPVEGDVTVVGGRLIELPGAHVTGRITTLGIGGPFLRAIPGISTSSSGNGNRMGDELMSSFNPFDYHALPWRAAAKVLGDFLVLLCFLIFPLRTRVAMERLERHPGLAAAVGLGGWIAVLPVLFLLAITVILIPLIAVEAIAVVVAALIGKAALALIIGNRLMVMANAKADPSPLLTLVVGLVLLTAAELIPIAGLLVTMLVLLIGVGATLLSLMQPTAFGGTFGGVPTAPAGPTNVTPPPIGGPPMTL